MSTTTPKKDLVWNLRMAMAKRDIWTGTELHRRLTDFGLKMSSAHVSRSINERPQRMNMDFLIALVNVLDCQISDLLVMETKAGLSPDTEPKRKNPVAKDAKESKKTEGSVKSNVTSIDSAKTPPKGGKTVSDETLKRLIGPKVRALPIPKKS